MALVFRLIMLGFTSLLPLFMSSSVSEIQYVDLDQQSNLHQIIDRRPGQYLGHVSTTLLEDGKTILMVYPQGHGRGAIQYRRSEDGGQTWSELLTTPKSWETSLETPTIHQILNPKTGKIRLILWSGLYPARIATSDDLGLTWSELKKVGDWGGIVIMGSVETLPDGRVWAMFHDDGRFFTEGGKAGRFDLFQTYSSDGGETWSQPESVWNGIDNHLCEPGSLWSPDRSTLAVLLRENRRRNFSQIMFTKNGGKSWTSPRAVSLELTGDRHTVKRLPDGRYFITYRDMAMGSPYWGDWVAWIGTWDDIVLGRSGQFKLRLKDNKDGSDCAYPGLEILPDGSIFAATYGHWESGKEPYILSIRFSSADIARIVPQK